MTAAVIYFLFAVSGGDMPGLAPLAQFESQEACQAALSATGTILAQGENATHLMCVPSDALQKLANTD